MKRLLLWLLLIIALSVTAAIFLVPWNSVLENRLTAFLRSQGMENVTFTLENVGFYEATLNNVAIGADNPLRLQSIKLQYTPQELAEGNFRDLSLTGLDLQLLQTEEGWKIAGLEGFPTSAKDEVPSSISISDIVDILPFTKISVTGSTLTISGENLQTILPFDLVLEKAAQKTLSLTMDSTNVSFGNTNLSLGSMKAQAVQDQDRNWAGEWNIESIDMGDAAPIPALSGGGKLAYTDHLIIYGALSSANKQYKASFQGLYDPSDAKNNALTITTASFPFKDGILSTRNVVIPLDGKKNITVKLDVNKVSVDALLQTLTGSRVTATGTVSGSVPVILKKDGTYSLGKGRLKADSEGVIQMSADAIPGDNAQVELVRKVLENLNYSVFSAAIDTSGGRGMAVKLTLEGSNPDVYDGRLIKLNVNLTGDVLDFIQQNAMLFTNPEKLLEQAQ